MFMCLCVCVCNTDFMSALTPDSTSLKVIQMKHEHRDGNTQFTIFQLWQ